MQRHSIGVRAIAIVMLIGVLGSPLLASAQSAPVNAAQGCNSDDATGPCFAKVDDILGGQRHLLRNDDLVVSIDVKSDSTSTLENYRFDTKNLSPGTPSKLTVAETDCTETPQSTRLGRMYNLKNDVIVNYAVTKVSTSSGEVCSQTVFVIDPGDGDKVLDQFGTFPATEPRLALFDADSDGYDDLFVMAFDTNPEINGNVMWFFSPSDVDDPTAGLTFRFQKLLDSDFTPRSNVVTGDFNGDGAMDIAWVGAAADGPVKVHFASVCPAKDWVVLGTTCSQGFEIVLSGETIDTSQTWTATSRTFPRIGLAAGDYDGVLDSSTGRADAELVLINVPVTKGDALAFVYDFDADLEPTAANAAGTALPDSGDFPVGVSDSFPVGLPPFMASGRLDWSERKEQVVTGWTAFPWDGLWVLRFGDDLSFTVAHDVGHDRDTFSRIRGIATGRFDPAEELAPLVPSPSRTSTNRSPSFGPRRRHQAEKTKRRSSASTRSIRQISGQPSRKETRRCSWTRFRLPTSHRCWLPCRPATCRAVRCAWARPRKRPSSATPRLTPCSACRRCMSTSLRRPMLHSRPC